MPHPSLDPIYKTLQLDRIDNNLCRVHCTYEVDRESDDHLKSGAREETVRWNQPSIVRIEVEGREVTRDAFSRRFGPGAVGSIESDLTDLLNP